MPTREDAWQLLNEYTRSEHLIKHALAVEAAMRAYAAVYGEDEDMWALAGLLHDLDYDRFPDPNDHPRIGARVLEERGYSEEVIYAVKAHADYMGLPRRSRMDRALFAVDELCGFIIAVALVRPGRRIAEVPVQSVQKKLRDKAFARTVSREDIRRGAEELGVPLDEHIQRVIAALSERAAALGLGA